MEEGKEMESDYRAANERSRGSVAAPEVPSGVKVERRKGLRFSGRLLSSRISPFFAQFSHFSVLFFFSFSPKNSRVCPRVCLSHAFSHPLSPSRSQR